MTAKHVNPERLFIELLEQQAPTFDGVRLTPTPTPKDRLPAVAIKRVSLGDKGPHSGQRWNINYIVADKNASSAEEIAWNIHSFMEECAEGELVGIEGVGYVGTVVTRQKPTPSGAASGFGGGAAHQFVSSYQVTLHP